MGIRYKSYPHYPHKNPQNCEHLSTCCGKPRFSFIFRQKTGESEKFVDMEKEKSFQLIHTQN